MHRLAAPQHLAGGRRQQAGDDAQQRRLAGAGAAEQRDHLALAQGEVDVVQHHEIGVGVLVIGLPAVPAPRAGSCWRDGGVHATPLLQPSVRRRSRIGVERPPQQAVEQHDEAGHHRHAQHDARHVALVGRLGDIGAQTVRRQLRVTPGRHLGDDGGVPGAARGGDRAGDVVGEDARDHHLAPPQPAADAEIARRPRAGRPGNAAAPATTLNRMYHWVPRIISGVSQMSASQVEVHDEQHERREQQIGGERGEELRHRLRPPGPDRAQPEPDADRHPDQACQHHQHRRPAAG